MNEKALFTCGLSLVLLLGLVALSWAAVQPRLPVAEPGARRTVKHYLSKAEAFEIDHWDFESDNGQWTPGLPGEDPHTTTNRYCSADSAWWFGIDQFNGYDNNWRNYLDTDPHPVTVGGISLQFNHMWYIEKGIMVPAPDDAWDIANLQISVNGGPFMPINPHFSGWSGYAYTCTSSYAYGVEWNVGHNYGGWENQNPSWPACDMSDIHLTIGDHPFHLNPGIVIQVTDVVVFRFEFCSDLAYSSAEGEPVEGWYVNDIVITNDNGTYTNNGSNAGATLQMHPGYYDFPADWEWVTDNYAPHEYKSATHSWWVPDTTVNGNSWLVSPWIELPDTAMLVWVDYYQDQFSPGAAIGGYLADYFYWYVRTKSEMKWKELSHDYDRHYDSTCCDWNVNWRLWENDSLYNGTFFAVPDKVPYGSKVQFAIKFMTDDDVQYQGKQYCNERYEDHDARGLYIDDFTVWGQEFYCQYDQNMGLFWETECSRPLPLSVPAGSSWAVKMLVRSLYACYPTDFPTEVDASVNPPNTWAASTTIPAGYPPNHDTLITIGAFTASQAAGTAQIFNGKVTLASDENPSDDEYPTDFLFFVTDSLKEYMGYDDLRMKTGQRSWTPYDGVGVWFEPNYNWGGYELLDIRWQSAYAGSTRVKIYHPVIPMNPWDVYWPPTAPSPIPCRVDTSLDLSGASVVFDTTVYVPMNDWRYITFYDEQGNVRPALRDLDGAFLVYLCWEGISADSIGGVGFDDSKTIGGHTFLGQGCNPSYLHHYCHWEEEQPWQDAIIRASVGDSLWRPTEFIRGDLTGDGVVDTLDGKLVSLWLSGGCPHLPCGDAADFDDDGLILICDLIAIVNFANGQGPPPEPPWPDCGIDPTADDLNCLAHYYCMGLKREFIRGDYDADGQLLTNDPLMELQWIFGAPGAIPPSCEDAADYDDNGAILTCDPLLALKYIFGIPGTFPPPPFPDCGIDPTEDYLDCRWHTWCYCHTGGKAAGRRSLVSVEGAENRVVVGEVSPIDGVVRVPVDLTLSEVVCGFDISIGYDASSLRFKKVVGGDGYDFYAVDTRQEGVVRIGGVPDIEMAELMGAGTHRVGEIVFTVERKADVALNWRNVEVYGSNVQPLSVEWVDGVVKAGAGLPKQFALSQNYPNPFNPITQIRYELPVDCQVRLDVYNVVGQRVATLVDGQQKAGYKLVSWNAHNMASGVYFYKLTAGDFASIRKMVLLK